MYDIITLTLSATEQSTLTISPTFRLILPSSNTESDDPAGIVASLTICAVVFVVCPVCAVVLSIVTEAVTWALCTLANVSPKTTRVLPVEQYIWFQVCRLPLEQHPWLLL